MRRARQRPVIVAVAPGAITAKLVSHANRVTGKGSLEGAAQLPSPLQGALMAGDDDNPLFLGGLRPQTTDITDAMGAAIATGRPLLHCTFIPLMCPPLQQISSDRP